jgi:hypothetical protein
MDEKKKSSEKCECHAYSIPHHCMTAAEKKEASADILPPSH